ncbi:unnamed protein product [Candidula unifasciata]|uniref:Uncharacterized protein n=1 Tax=Candidula unifasciata TaxID=100452 RepID=A0A8S3YYQ1_9EUPU|nr:unnamed protein product [Candidula unifasciata]
MSVNLMSASAILKNIFEFIKILNLASHESVALWDDLSLTNALDWVDYCQELYTEIKGQDFEQDVNSQMRQMVAFLDPVSCLVLSVDSLGCARTLLVEALISNPRFPSSSQERLYKILAKCPEGLKILKEVQQKCSETTSCLQLCTDVLSSLTDRSDYLPSLRCDLQASILMDSIVEVVKHIKKGERFDKYCQCFYNKLTQTQEGWNILVHLFTKEVSEFPEEGTHHQDKILKAFLTRVKEGMEGDISTSKFWTVPVATLTKASCVSEQFFLTYLDALLVLGDSYLPYIQHGFLSWRCEEHLTMKELCQHFQKLLESTTSSSPDRKMRILGAITDRARGSEFTVWQDLVRNLMRLFKQG